MRALLSTLFHPADATPQDGAGLAAIALLAFALLSGASLSAAQSNNIVTFGGSSHYPPFHYTDANGTANGFDVAVFRDVARLSGWDVAFRLDEWESIQQALTDGEVTVVPMFESAERRQRYLFSDPINVEYHLLFGLADSASYSGINALAGFRIAAERGAFATREIVQRNDDIIVIGADSESAALDLVLSGDADLALLPATIGWHSITTAGINSIVAVSPPILPASYAFAVTPGRPELLPAINSAIEQLQRSNRLSELRQQWLVPTPATTIRDALGTALWVVVPLALLAALALIWLAYARGQLQQVRVAAHQHRKQLEKTRKQAEQLSSHDGLTGFPNRKTFTQQVRQALHNKEKEPHGIAVAILCLHNLNTIQDLMDDDAGEALIREFSRVVRAAVTHDTGYLGAGQFAFLLKSVNDRQHALEQIQQIIPDLSRTLSVAGMRVHVQVSGGLAVAPEHAQSETELIQKAKLAMSNAMRSGSQLLLFSDSMQPDPQKLQLMSDLKVALSENHLQWAFQPQYWVKEQRVMGSEMLVRWRHADYGWVSPSDFVVWAEQMGNIQTLTHAAVGHAFKTLESISGRQEPFRLSVNFSANDLANADLVQRIVRNAGKHHHQLTVEITETALMHDTEKVLHHAELLKQAGVELSLDDYGTGYSSLEYLKTFSFDEIKIDRMFINDITRIDRNLKLARASIQLAHNLGAKVVAEGVEDRETAELLIDMGCDILQGYYIGRPQVPEHVSDYLSGTDAFRIT